MINSTLKKKIESIPRQVGKKRELKDLGKQIDNLERDNESNINPARGKLKISTKI